MPDPVARDATGRSLDAPFVAGDLDIVLLPHTHWDREWWLPFSWFSELLVTMLDELLDLLDREPALRHFHLDGQVSLLDDYVALNPQRAADLRRHLAAGRLSAGPWYTQMDEFLTSGESQIRNLEWGCARSAAHGAPLPVDGPPCGYLPDQFGHIGQMPQLLRMAGIGHAVVWRGVPSAIDRATFRWQSPDGSEVLAEYFVHGYDGARHLDHATSGEDLARRLGTLVEREAPYLARAALLVPVGGDHRSAVVALAPLVGAAAKRLGARVRIGSIASFLAAADATGTDPGSAEPLPLWTGELRSAARAHLLPNVYSARTPQKRLRARVENLVERYAEPLAALVPGFPWPRAELDEAWRRLLWNGAHDSVCGCSHDQVAHDVDMRYAEAWGIAGSIVGRAMTTLAAQVSGRAGGGGAGSAPGTIAASGAASSSAEPATLLFNPSPFERDGVPGLGWSIRPSHHAGRPGSVTATPTAGDPGLGGPGWRWHRPRGTTITPRLEGDFAAFGPAIAVRLLDEQDVGDLYTFCPPPGGGRRPPNVLAVDGDRLVARWERLTVTLGAEQVEGEPFVRLAGTIDNLRPNHRLWLRVAIGHAAERSVAAAPFELVERPLCSEGGARETPSATWPAAGAVLAGSRAVLSEGVVEYEVAEGEIGIVLLRAVGTISRKTLATRPAKAGPDIPTPAAQLLGRTAFALGLMPDADRASLLDASEQYALPLLSVEATIGSGGPRRRSLARLSGARLSAIRRVEGRVEVRVWNETGHPAEARVNRRTLVLGPYRIETLRLPPGRHDSSEVPRTAAQSTTG